MFSIFKPFAKKLLEEHDVSIAFVDVGSRNGVLELPDIATRVDAIGFEPNPVEYEKLLSGKTDASRIGIRSPKYRSLKYYPYALSDTDGRTPFYVTKGPGAAGIIEPNIPRLREIAWKGRTFKGSFADEIFTIERIVDVEVRTLKKIAKIESLDHIDYLKIDVEGAEYNVLAGAGDVLNNVGVIKVEVCFIPFRKGQKMFTDVDVLLRQYGFDLLNYQISPAQIGFKERIKPWSFGPTIGFPERYGQALSCDAIYINRTIEDKKRALAQALVLIEKNYLDEALFILRNKVGIEDGRFLKLLRDYQGNWRAQVIDAFFRFGRKLVRKPSLWK